MLIDRFLPEYDEIEHHEAGVDAPADRTYQAVKEIDLARSPIVLALLAVRGLPHLFTGAVKPKRRLRLDDILESGFVVLAEEPGRELVLGIVGKFWRPGSGVHRIEASEFTGFDEPGYSKAVWNFLVSERAGGGSTLVTETRVVSTDADARRNFGWYWRLIGPFSALIRRIVLGQVKREAESAALV
ncbi:MAG TPA: hypothetical protein VKE97_05920 [Acidimicrobiia bacterium]|nr:hypothetical protein [Acidimicrobiia bacterium]